MKTKLIDIIELEEFTDDLIAKVQHQLPLESSYYFVAGINAVLNYIKEGKNKDD